VFSRQTADSLQRQKRACTLEYLFSASLQFSSSVLETLNCFSSSIYFLADFMCFINLPSFTTPGNTIHKIMSFKVSLFDSAVINYES